MLDQCIWIVLQVWSLFAVYVIIGYFLLVSWVTNEDIWDVLTKRRIQDVETVDTAMTCAVLKRGVSHSNCTGLDIFYVVYIVVTSKLKPVIRYFGNNTSAKMFRKQGLFCWQIFVIPEEKCEEKIFLKNFICRRKKYIWQKEVESVIDINLVTRAIFLFLEEFLFSLFAGKNWVISLMFQYSNILLESMFNCLLSSFASSVAFLFSKWMWIMISGFTLKKNILISLQNNSVPQPYEKHDWEKMKIISLSSGRHDKFQLLSSNAIKGRNCRACKGSGFVIHELRMRIKGNGEEKKGEREVKERMKEKGRGVKYCRELESSFGGGGGGGRGEGRDDEDNDPSDYGLEDKRTEDSSHEEEVSERDPVEPIDDYFHPLPSIFYIPTNVPGPGANAEDFESAYPGCSCSSDKNGTCNQSCPCVLRSMGPNYDDVGFLLLEKLSGCIPVFECSEYCECSDNCGNRKIQFGPLRGLTIFETTTNVDVYAAYTDNSFKLPSDSFKCTGKGLGLRMQKCVSKGSFICEYAGEIIGREEALKRWRNDYIQGNPNYILALQEWISKSQRQADIKDSSFLHKIQLLDQAKCVDSVGNEEHLEMSKIVTYIDPTRVGNIGRYANHSCDPNAVAVIVRVGSPIPRLCLFAAKDILPGEEVTFDYAGLEVGLPKELEGASSSHAKEDYQWKNENSFLSECILHSDLQSKDLEGKKSGNASLVYGSIESSLNKRLKFHLPLEEDKDSISQNHRLDQSRTLCLCGTKKCRKYLPFSNNWI